MVSFVRLATTFAAAPGESLLSWLSRLCAANDISTSEFSSQIMGRDAGEFAALATRDEHALALECVTGVGAASIREMMHSGPDPALTTFFDQPIPWSSLERSKRRIAPGRLAKDQTPFLRALWSFSDSAVNPHPGSVWSTAVPVANHYGGRACTVAGMRFLRGRLQGQSQRPWGPRKKLK